MLRSVGMEPTQFNDRAKWHLLARMIPLVDNTTTCANWGLEAWVSPIFTRRFPPNSILISGGQTTVANLFYNMANRTIGLVGMWDCVAFDEVAGITFKDKDGIQIMKDYMASGSFARGKEEKNANASMVFVGNINQSVDVLLKTSHLFDPFPEAMAYDSAFFDRMHYYLPGWEIPKMRPEYFTNEYGFITDYLAEFFREMRKRSFSDAIDQQFRLGGDLKQRDVIAVRKTVSGMIKLLYLHGEFEKDDVAEILEYSLEGRRRVKEQLKKIGGTEFYDVHFSYLDNDSFEEHFVSVPEQGFGKLIPDGQGKPGHIYTVVRGDTGMLGVYKIKTEVVGGNDKFEVTGVGYDREAKENLKTAQNYFKANKKLISGSISIDTNNFLMHIADCQGVGTTPELALCSFVALCSASLRKPVQSQMCVLGNMSIGGTISKVEELANTLQVCFDAGQKKYYSLCHLPPTLRLHRLICLPSSRHPFTRARRTLFLRRWVSNSIFLMDQANRNRRDFMPSSPNQRMKLLYLMKILLEQTDETHTLTIAEMIDALAEYDIKAERKAIYTDMELLRKYGLEIEMQKSRSVGYYIDARQFELPELKLLVDAVQSSRFITARKSNELIKKLSSLTSVYQAKELKRQVVMAEQPKPLNESIYYNIDAIHEAINGHQKIDFKYFDYDADKKRVYRKNGDNYCQTPVALCWNDDKYYLICYSSKYDGFTHYRVDRMSSVEVSAEAADKIDKKEFNVAEHTKQVFGMYSGELITAKLRFDNSLVNTVLDKFGADLPLRKNGDHFEISVDVSSSPVFLSWVFQFGNKAEIVAPDGLRGSMAALIAESAKKYN